MIRRIINKIKRVLNHYYYKTRVAKLGAKSVIINPLYVNGGVFASDGIQ